MLPKPHDEEAAPGASTVVHVGIAIAEADPAVAPASAAATIKHPPIRLIVEAIFSPPAFVC